MDLEVLRKKLSSFRTDGGSVRSVSNDMLLEVLSCWEQWTGSAKDFYKGIGISKNGMASILGKAKRLKREGYSAPFQELKVEGVTSSSLMCEIELQENNKIIRFGKIDLLLEYLKKVA